MTVFNEYWELPNSRFWLAEIDTDHGRDFPILTGYILWWKSCDWAKVPLFSSVLFSIYVPKRLWENCKEDEQTMANLVHLTAVRKQNVS